MKTDAGSPRAVSVAEMQMIDDRAINEWGIPRLVLMEHAGYALAREVAATADRDAPVWVCCGRGYNGGDGFAAARHLRQAGFSVRVLMAAPEEQLREEPRIFASILKHMRIPCTVYEDLQKEQYLDWFTHAGCIVDALLGIGVQSEVRDPMASIIRMINSAAKQVVAADVPSGLNADTGAALGEAVCAKITVTFGLAKRGCLTDEGKRYTGRLIVDPITFPPELLGEG